MRSALLLGTLLGLALPARAAPPIEAFTLRGPPEVDRAPLERALAAFVGKPADEETLLAVLADLERTAPIGGIDFDVDGGRVRVELDAPPTRIERVVVRIDDARDPRAAGALEARRLRAAKQKLRLAEGLRFHRYLARLDARTLWSWSVNRGRLDAQVLVELRQQRDLTAVTLRLVRGPIYRLGDVRIRGFSPDGNPVVSRSGDRASPVALRADAERVERRVCREGYGAARVEPRVRRRGKVLDVDLVVHPGSPTRIRQLEWRGEPLPPDSSPAWGGGLDATLDLNALDSERVPYLGVLFGGRGLTTGPLPGLPLSEWSARVGANVPLYTNRRGQHGVLLARLQGRWVEAVGLGGRKSPPRSGELPLFAHQRLTPRARGYAPDAIRLRFPVGREPPPAGAGGAASPCTPEQIREHDPRCPIEEVEMGGLAAYTATLAVRVPMPWRRNALVPFADFARVGSRSDLPWEDVFASLGASLEVSLFDERLEGSVHAAWPLRDDVEAQYVGLSAGGSFGE